MGFSATKAVVCASIAVGLSAAVSEAALYANESFEYTAGAVGDGSLAGKAPGNGFGTNAWTVATGTNPAAVVVNSLSASPAVYTAGAKASLDLTTNNRVTLGLDTGVGGNFSSLLNGSGNVGADGTSLYISYLFANDDVKGDQGLELHRDGSRVLLFGSRGTNTASNLTAATGSSSLTTVATFGGASRNAVRQLVLKIDFLAGADQISGWLSPNPAAPGAATFSGVNAGDLSFDALGIFTSANSSGRSTKYDEVRIGQSLSDVVSTSAGTFVPEPATLGLVGLLGLAAKRRR